METCLCTSKGHKKIAIYIKYLIIISTTITTTTKDNKNCIMCIDKLELQNTIISYYSYKLQAETHHWRSRLINACLNDVRELMKPMLQVNEFDFHRAVAEGKNKF